MNGFALTYESFDPAEEGLREALTSTGNGYLCSRGTAEWEDADGVHHPGTYVHSQAWAKPRSIRSRWRESAKGAAPLEGRSDLQS